MQTISRNYRSLSLLWEMHRDTLIVTAAIVVGLSFGAALGTMMFAPV